MNEVFRVLSPAAVPPAEMRTRKNELAAAREPPTYPPCQDRYSFEWLLATAGGTGGGAAATDAAAVTIRLPIRARYKNLFYVNAILALTETAANQLILVDPDEWKRGSGSHTLSLFLFRGLLSSRWNRCGGTRVDQD